MNRLANPLAPRGFTVPEKTSQIKVWVRKACGLDDDIVVFVTELVCRKDGCPDIETVIGIMRPGEKIETIRLRKAIADVTSHDLPRG
ncbi:MAG: nitrate reductase [Mesorhizobium sp.]|uniref:nitrate reductase n=1 Tax=Mesorhizobium sp. TaxID=1871066 RepID=UPI0012290A7C|nr:nitrate reductase [Mesorhizobium sp.]TIL40325.1 MAG: nitrate reductase [Mesorhizobium sp.]TIM40871.1 MAG: nitrate reductase [Mesorhizobium sp.]